MSKLFSCVVIGDVLAEPDTVVKAMVTRKSVASRTSFTGTSEELEAAKANLKRDIAAMHTTGSFPTVTTSVVAAGGVEVTIQFTLVQDPDALLNISPPPNLVLLCYTPVAQTTLKSLEMLWVPTLTQMFARPQVVLAATRVETLAHQKIMEKVGTKPVTCETIIDKASSWRAVDYVEVSAACNVNLNTLLSALGMACLHIPAQRITTELAKDQRKECMKPILSTQSVWTYKRHPVTGRVFYGNRITEQSQWTRPDDYDGEEPELTAAEKDAEEQAKRTLEEQRTREAHEKQLEEQSRQEVAVHNERVHELEKRSALLTRDVAHLNIRVGEIRDVIQRNRREREDLERQQDQIAEARFAKSTIDDDLKIERDINDAKIKLFMLEGRVALADDMGVQTTEIAEAILVNNSLAQQLRELIAEQLKVRKQGSASQTRIDSLTRQHEDATALLASYATKAPTVKNSLIAAEEELKRSEEQRRQLLDKSRSLNTTLNANDHGAYERQQHIVRLQSEIKRLDEQIIAVKKEKGIIAHSPPRTRAGGGGGGGSPVKGASSSSSGNTTIATTHPLQAEEARAQLEQQTLIHQLTAAAAECAQYEIGCRQKLELLKYLVSEYSYASGKRAEVANSLADRAAIKRDDKLLGLSYPISTPHELKQLQAALDDRIVELGTTRHRLISEAEQNERLQQQQQQQRNNGLNSTPNGRRSAANANRASSVGAGSRANYAFGSTTPTGRTSTPNRALMTSSSSASLFSNGRSPNRTQNTSAGSGRATTPNGRAMNRSSIVGAGAAGGDGSFATAAADGKTAQTSSYGGHQLNRASAIAELNNIKQMLQNEQASEETAEQLAQLCRTAEQRVRSIKAKGTQQTADLKDALGEALREIGNLERLQGYESSSPLERLVALVDGVVTASHQLMLQQQAQRRGGGGGGDGMVASVAAAAELTPAGAQLVAEVANLFTERMLQSVPPSERATVAHQLNHAASRDLAHSGPTPSAQQIANAIHGTVTTGHQSHHNAVDAAAKRGVIAATLTSSGAVGGGSGGGASLSALSEKAKRLEARHDESAAAYARHAERAKQLLGIMQPQSARERDDQARMQHRFYKR